MRWLGISMLSLAACGGSSAEWAGEWKQPTGFPVASCLEATLS